MVDRKFVKLRCPCKKRHNKRRGDMIIREENCNALMGFIDTSVDGSNGYEKCRDCKCMVYYEVKNGIVYMQTYSDKTKISLTEAKVVVNDT